jgi:hypothetical protein
MTYPPCLPDQSSCILQAMLKVPLINPPITRVARLVTFYKYCASSANLQPICIEDSHVKVPQDPAHTSIRPRDRS